MPGADDRTMAGPGSEIVIYSTTWCGYCARARGLLDRKGVAYREIKLDETPAERETMMNRAGGRRSVPQIFIGERHVGGYDELSELERSGELDRLLGHASAARAPQP
jgi:glutaredoxin 3